MVRLSKIRKALRRRKRARFTLVLAADALVCFGIAYLFAKYVTPTEVFEFLHRWQESVTGAIGAAALIATVAWTLNAERRREQARARAIRIVLVAEISLFGDRAVAAFEQLKPGLLAHPTRTQFTNVTVESIGETTAFVDPIIYQRTAGELGVLGRRAADIVRFYSHVASVRDQVARLSGRQSQFHVGGHLPQNDVLDIMKSLLDAAAAANSALKTLRGTPGAKFSERQARVRDLEDALAKLPRSPSE